MLLLELIVSREWTQKKPKNLQESLLSRDTYLFLHTSLHWPC